MKAVASLMFAVFASLAFAQPYQLSPNAPQDTPFPTTQAQMQKLEEAIRPLVKQARASYPTAKRKFLAGLPPGEAFFVTALIYDQRGLSEQVFIAVHKVEERTIFGEIASNILLVKGYKAGDAYRLPEAEIMDWLITKPDGSEEGNFVGKFMDTYHPQ